MAETQSLSVFVTKEPWAHIYCMYMCVIIRANTPQHLRMLASKADNRFPPFRSIEAICKGADLSRVTPYSVRNFAPYYPALLCTTGTRFSLRAFVAFSLVPIALPRSVPPTPRTARAVFFCRS